MRQRTTWNAKEILSRTAGTTQTAATTRTADPYAMNQDHIKQQPSADKYLTGDPSAFAEDITTPNNWEVEYSGGAVKRNEIGMPEDRPDTFNHPEKTASQNHDLLLKKADITVRIARRMLGANAPEGAIEEQAASLMHLPDQEVINTYNRLAGEMPPALKEHMEQKQQQAGEKESEEQVQEQAKQAAIRGDKKAFDAAVAKLVTLRQANGQQQGQPMQQQGQAQQQQAQTQQQAQGQQGQGQQAGQQQQQAGQDQQSAWYDTKAPRPGHPGPDTGPYAGQQQQAQGQVPPPAFQQQGQGQQQMPPAQAGQQQFPGGQFPTAQGQQAPMQQQAQGQPQQGVEAQVQQMIEQAAQQMQASKQANDPQQQAPQQQQAGQQQQQAQGQPQQAPMQQQGAGYQQAQGQPQQQAPAQQQAQVQQQAQGQPQQAPMQQQAQGLTNPNQNISPNYAGQQQGHMMQASDDQLIDQMLMPGGAPAAAPGQIAEMDIQMEAPSMDIGDVAFQPGEDEMLRQLFSNDEAQAAQQAQEAQGQGQQGQVQASNVRTAALRTVGTRPSAGVARIGGAGAPPGRGQEVDRLTSLWQSAPDVREVFGLKTT